METIERKQTVTNTLGRSICQTVSLVFTAVLILRHIVVTQKDFFLFGRYLVNMPCSRETILSLLTETVVLCILLSDSGIESTDSWRNLIIVIICVIFKKRRYCGLTKRCFMRSVSACMPLWLFSFFTSMKANGKPFTKIVMSGR